MKFIQVPRYMQLFSVVVLSLCLAACGGSSSGGSMQDDVGEETGNENEEQANTVEVDCDRPISFYVENLDNNFPDNLASWDQLECYIDDQTRIAEPEFFLLVGNDTPDLSVTPDVPQTAWEHLQGDLALFELWPVATNFGYNLSEAPPYLIDDARSYTDVQWEQKLRAMATIGVYLKSLGQRVTVDFFYPPFLFAGGNETIPTINSASEFLTWWRDSYIPERVSIAVMAERINAEYYQPWDIEPGQFLRAMGDSWLDALSEEDQIATAQQAIDELYDAVRPVFSGSLILINYDRYAAHGDHWRNLDLSEWDIVYFALFTEGNVEATENYLSEQLDVYTTMIARDNIDNWLFGVTVDQDVHERLLTEGESFDAIEADIYNAIFTAADQLSIPSNGITVPVGAIQTDAAEQVTRSYFDTL